MNRTPVSQPAHHTSVMAREILDLMNVQPRARLIDCTVGDGGHTIGFLRAAGTRSQVLALDRDRAAIDRTRTRLEGLGLISQVTLVRSPFDRLAEVARRHGFAEVDNILLDLGVSALQLDAGGRGFSFMRSGPLDMRMDQSQALTAQDIVSAWSEEELSDLLRTLGEERHARRVARSIVARRPITSTAELCAAVTAAVPSGRPPRIHPATRTFQALRLAVNDELGQLERVLPQTLELLADGGRLLVIAFHSLEDRIAKRFLHRHGRRKSHNKYARQPQTAPPALTLPRRGAFRPSPLEIRGNPRSRSVRLRVGIRNRSRAGGRH